MFSLFNPYGRMDHESVPTSVTPPGMVAELSRASKKLLWWRVPLWLRPELTAIAKKLHTGRLGALELSLSYEMGGGACKTAAIFKDGEYRMFRILEWDLTDDVRNSVQWQKVGRAMIRAYPGFIGALTGYRPSTGEAVAMNLSPDWGKSVNLFGKPVAWEIRKALVSRGDLASNLLNSPPVIVPAWAVVVDGNKAYGIHFRTRGKHELIRFNRDGKGILLQNQEENRPGLLEAMTEYVNDNDHEPGDVLDLQNLPEEIGGSPLAVDAVIM